MVRRPAPGEFNPGDEFERMIEQNEITFHPALVQDLEPWGQTIVTQFLLYHKIQWLLGDKKVGTAYCLKLQDPKIHYVDIMPDKQEFMWCTEGHHEGIHPDEVLAYFMRKKYGAGVAFTDLPDGSQIIRIDRPQNRNKPSSN